MNELPTYFGMFWHSNHLQPKQWPSKLENSETREDPKMKTDPH